MFRHMNLNVNNFPHLQLVGNDSNMQFPATGEFVCRRLQNDAPKPNVDSAAGPTGNENERWQYVRIKIQNRGQSSDRELRIYMTWPKQQQANDRFTLQDGQGTEICVVRKDESVLPDRLQKQFTVRSALQANITNLHDIETCTLQPLHDFDIDIFVRQQPEFPKLHPATSVVRRISLRMQAAAYSSACSTSGACNCPYR